MRAESPIHFLAVFDVAGLVRAFSPWRIVETLTRSDALGWYGIGLLARIMRSPKPARTRRAACPYQNRLLCNRVGTTGLSLPRHASRPYPNRITPRCGENRWGSCRAYV